MEADEASKQRRGKQASPLCCSRRTVTRSITRNRSNPSEEEAPKADSTNKTGARRRFLDKCKSTRVAAGMETNASKFPDEALGKEDADAEFCPLKFHGCSSSDAVQEIVCTFNEKKIDILKQLGLGGLQYLKRGYHNSRHLVFWLLKRMDVENMEIRLADGTRVKMTLDSVDKILGIRCTGTHMATNSSKVTKYVKIRLQERFGFDESKEFPDLDDLRKVLRRDYGQDMCQYDEETFMIAMSAFCCAYMFGPGKRAASVPADIWEFISFPKKLLNCNWGGYVLMVLQSSARAVQMNMRSNPNSILLGGCWLYLQVVRS